MLLDTSEVNTLIKEIYSTYGYDFSGYSQASFIRRVNRYLLNKKLNLNELRIKIINNPNNFENFLQELTVNVTEMFRDPSFFLALREKIIPILSTYPYIKIWDAGCSTGEELYSLAIVLKEENLLEKTKIYATDLNQKVLLQAKEGIYPLNYISNYTQNYYLSGGKTSFSEYYSEKYGNVKFDNSLVKNVIFYPHNLATDGSFNEFHLIICRNVLIYFNKELQDKVFTLFYNSLARLGYLGLGKKETLALANIQTNFEIVDKSDKIYRKVV